MRDRSWKQRRWGKYGQGMALNGVGERLPDNNCSWNDDWTLLHLYVLESAHQLCLVKVSREQPSTWETQGWYIPWGSVRSIRLSVIAAYALLSALSWWDSFFSLFQTLHFLPFFTSKRSYRLKSWLMILFHITELPQRKRKCCRSWLLIQRVYGVLQIHF